MTSVLLNSTKSRSTSSRTAATCPKCAARCIGANPSADEVVNKLALASNKVTQCSNGATTACTSKKCHGRELRFNEGPPLPAKSSTASPWRDELISELWNGPNVAGIGRIITQCRAYLRYTEIQATVEVDEGAVAP
jgi:hypothetical protein